MDDLLREFLTETNESLAVLDLELVKLEQNPEDPKLLGSIFRIVHTIKGTCGFLGLARLERVAHASESVLGKIRDGELAVSESAIDLVLASLDRIKSLLAALEESEAEPAGDDSELIDRLTQLAEGGAPAPSAAAPAPKPAAPPKPIEAPKPAAAKEPAGDEEEPPLTDEDIERILAEPMSAPVEEAQEGLPEPVTTGRKRTAATIIAARPHASEDFREAEPTPAPARAPTPAPATAPAAAMPGGEAPETKESAVAAQSIRVNVDVLENLMTMISELVLTRNQLMQILRAHKDTDFAAPLQRLSHVTTELQEGVMKTRMQPIGNAWAKLPRIIRDLSHELHKKIDLQMLGSETELDRQVLEMIRDPLTHMVRNSADHGIELPAERVRAGKPETGTITLNAYHEGGHIIIEISDDGRGLDTERIKRKAALMGLASESDLAAMSEQHIHQYIFKPGFSTATTVTSVSGRGVGMDVVRSNMEKIGGTVEMKSQHGKGSLFIIKIPLTLAIVSALIVECGSERFAIPQLSVVELVRAAVKADTSIEWLNNAPVLRLRDRLLPLVSLHELLKLGRRPDHPGETFIVVTQVGTLTFGIIVDRVYDTEEIVVKPVAPILRDIPIFSGNTILGDGSVIMILDPNGIATSAGEVTVGSGARADHAPARAAQRDDQTSLLLFRAGSATPKAVQLSLIARLEEIDLAKIERSNDRPVVQYRGKLMPIVTLDPSHELPKEGRRPILVFAEREHVMGLVVDEIVDIVEEELHVELTADRPGLLGSALVAGKATDIIDAGFYLTQVYSDWFGQRGEGEYIDDRRSSASGGNKRLLLIDDSPFFRNMLSPLLSAAGYQVTTAESGDHALRMCEAGDDFDVIVSDIEMPGMNGFEFATVVKNDSRWQSTPLVALSSHATQKDIARGRAAGFRDYVAKFDRDGLLTTLSEAINDRGAA
jgi:two-component system, chemotaxis family, sensor kinase CheA